jgi:hypothetical protein
VPRSQIKTATLVTEELREYVKVEGPLVAGPEEGGVTALTIYVVLVQPDVFAHGHEASGGGRVDVDVGWTVEARIGGSGAIAKGQPALAVGMLVTVEQSKAGEVPIPQTFTWTEEVVIA